MIEVRNVDLAILENHRAWQVSTAYANIGSRICRANTLRDGTNAVLLRELHALDELDRYAWRAKKARGRLAICCNGRAMSPDALATARRISALASCCSRAVFNCFFSRAVSDWREGFCLRGLALVDFGLSKPSWRALDSPDLSARRPPRPVVPARFAAFLLVFAICGAPGQSNRSESGRKYLQSEGSTSKVGQKLP